MQISNLDLLSLEKGHIQLSLDKQQLGINKWRILVIRNGTDYISLEKELILFHWKRDWFCIIGKGTGSVSLEKGLILYCLRWNWFCFIGKGTDSILLEKELILFHWKMDWFSIIGKEANSISLKKGPILFHMKGDWSLENGVILYNCKGSILNDWKWKMLYICKKG